MKGVRGGKLVSFRDKDEYQKMIDYLSSPRKFDPDVWPGWNSTQRFKFKKKAEKFELRDDGTQEPWPKGKVLHIKIFANKEATTPMLTKLFTPPDKIQGVLSQFHGTGKIAGHFGRNRLHPAVRNSLVKLKKRSTLHITVSQKTMLLLSFKPVRFAR